jgi:hypothetical protein
MFNDAKPRTELASAEFAFRPHRVQNANRQAGDEEELWDFCFNA